MEGKKCNFCGELPGFISSTHSNDSVYWALECSCKRTSFQRSKSCVEGEWESSTYKLTVEEAKKVEGLTPTDKNFTT